MFADIGNDLMRGLSQGITGGAGAVVSAMEGVNTSLASTAAGTLSAPSIAPILPKLCINWSCRSEYDLINSNAMSLYSAIRPWK